MSELALYRKYRPKKFADVLGQEEAVSVLERSIESKNFGHAYLFSGGRGTGKTTVARIFSAAIGCKPTDLIEMDAASNRGIDDVRALREAVRTMPFESPYKVYIIDEAHMLTKEAWNALLKTLEEPPAHVVFIMATTDREKVPDTIISRCQSFVFRQPNFDELKKFAIEVAKKEKVKLDGPSGEIIAMFGDGSYRDTLSVLEKVLARAKEGAIDIDTVSRVVGAPAHDLVNRVLRSIDSGDLADGLSAVREAGEEHVDMKAYLKLILQKLRAVLLLRYAPDFAKEFTDEFTPDDLALIRLLAGAEGKKINSDVLYEFLEASRRIGWSAVPSLPIELALIKVAGEPKA
ncbi:MAG: DNA polymerase III, subunit gamma and tau [Candidatus Lloydbacteria bacterium RIFCSPHIGHO2_02_FULL_54_17]|uniref:DNA polymerase III subunit gamma/tau n=1 Tax=Candidatus Lloydbacteria bacterium RIFCSPHIGHO2_02_FULL_54_17 TaxID=1798664 RepID=A0A1G2DC74_9BACT|nr:MAG: DNA polymerase III, subunit gamma and tau [Candidatus Lloydbacteria bacterium RIFCSPHIGHO2_02_FULL_54_17]OGZ14451.1 MAG: DNA polymerase III, subunit gamma and tau [Candidatus Lloydbacteria bacterium RIFCSPLOWO2_02_FULL_54_12]OGZ15467.1 MAG: DNA polymerase III, subunit gamma and tau [Candidatus Lloydbacteria bacterium RIFCSPLOWO2_01_FULL_54_18]